MDFLEIINIECQNCLNQFIYKKEINKEVDIEKIICPSCLPKSFFPEKNIENGFYLEEKFSHTTIQDFIDHIFSNLEQKENKKLYQLAFKNEGNTWNNVSFPYKDITEILNRYKSYMLKIYPSSNKKDLDIEVDNFHKHYKNRAKGLISINED